MLPRHTLLADTAIGLIATRGFRGVSHRALDATAGLPYGSACNIYPTRVSFLNAAADRVRARMLSKAAHARAEQIPALDYCIQLLNADYHLFLTMALFALDPSTPKQARDDIAVAQKCVADTIAELSSRRIDAPNNVLGILVANALMNTTDPTAIAHSLCSE